MAQTRRSFLTALAGTAGLASLAGLAACKGQDDQSGSGGGDKPERQDPEAFSSLKIDMGAWNYDEANDVYYQLGLQYCTKPATKTYESLSIYVPGGFFKGERRGNRFSCEIAEKAVVGSFTPETAPILIPLNSGNLSAQECPSKYSYDGLGRYLQAGCIYVYPGLRGRSSGYDSNAAGMYAGGSPWPVVDLKAAVRYLRYNAPQLPCDTSRVFVFGFSAGGGLALAAGAGGDCEDYLPYLKQIGAATCDSEGNDATDALFGAAAWNPQTGYAVADAAYEWERGQWSSAGDRTEGAWTAQLSLDLAQAYGEWVNEQGVWGPDGGTVTLDQTSGAIFGAGSYAGVMLMHLEDAATAFVSSTQFPYTETPLSVLDASFPGDPNREIPEDVDEAEDEAELGDGLESDAAEAEGQDRETEGQAGDDAALDDESDADAEEGAASDAEGVLGALFGLGGSDDESADDADAEVEDDADAKATSAARRVSRSSGISTVESTIYATAADYIDSLNEGQDYAWITYNQTQGTVTVLGLAQFFSVMVGAEKGVGAFDAFDRSTMVNQLFGLGEESTLHFSKMIAELIQANKDVYAGLDGWDDSYAEAWEEDLEKVDEFETPMSERVRLMDPMAFVDTPKKEGTQAPYWRINVGLNDTESPLGPALNLVLALPHADGVKDVQFTPVWGQGHVLAEREGTAAAALVDWVRACCADR